MSYVFTIKDVQLRFDLNGQSLEAANKYNATYSLKLATSLNAK